MKGPSCNVFHVTLSFEYCDKSRELTFKVVNADLLE